ncbi:uncharacterized protein I303_101890 [Kwoniella dejecticola CBS 10117]|uniref:Uncharacterized protein n=1 Tax=Kwoniella dejecticola CBS 10117 TaxID=1296121 RepID=A0A1A6ACH7_9TREE|nr:uncharacterized protein I303_01973 [Kwoniella dejecticola CBS 10117]OBR87761.1 hypothetical protein I303_01973 [Kwoniella dejecticola CBS 10117]
MITPGSVARVAYLKGSQLSLQDTASTLDAWTSIRLDSPPKEILIMPLSPVSVAVGTTIATAIVVIGTGYAFKKFVYDPHISHHIEALIAHHQHHHSQSQSHAPIPASGPRGDNDHDDVSIGRASTLYRDHTSLRRRNVNRSNSGSGSHEYEYELQGRLSASSRHVLQDETEYGGASKYELDESRISLLSHRDHDRQTTFKSNRLIDLDENVRPESPQDREIQEVIFNLAPTPLQGRSGSSTPSTLNPFVSPHDSRQVTEPRSLAPADRLDPRTSSTSFSFLSLSQASSPDQIYPHLHSGAEQVDALVADPGEEGDEQETGTPTIADDNERAGDGNGDGDDVISISDNGMTEYQDAEAYTPISRALSRNSIFDSVPSPRVNNADPLGEMGLSYVPVVPTTRGPMSVISMDGSESEWDVVSDAGR